LSGTNAPKARRGCVRRLQMEYRYEYLLLSVNPMSGVVNFVWIPCMNQVSLKPVLLDWKLDLVVWDGAGSHRGKSVGELGLKRVFLPSYSPELNLVERVFLESGRFVEGLVYLLEAMGDDLLEEDVARLSPLKWR
jgi:DDE superfamily endonuclease